MLTLKSSKILSNFEVFDDGGGFDGSYTRKEKELNLFIAVLHVLLCITFQGSCIFFLSTVVLLLIGAQ